MKNVPPQLGNFLTLHIWQEAIKLLDFQVKQKKRNKHYNTLSMYYYEKLGMSVSTIDVKEYFNEKVANNLFYVLEDEFNISTYLMPKPGLGLRNYKFFSYPMRSLYYAVGLYIFRLSWQFLEDVKADKKNIKSYYGASLSLNKNDLVISSNTIYFQKPYKAFRKQMRKELDGDTYNNVVIRLDIKDFYDEISISNLFDLLFSNIKPSVKHEMNFDPTTIEQLKFFFRFLSNGNPGIPQYDNDIISSFIGYLYLVFADLYIDSEILRDSYIVCEHRIIRYADDIYISLKLKDDISLPEKEDFIESLSARVADILYYRLGLKLNTKTRLYWLSNETDIDDLRRGLKKTSSQYQIKDDENEALPQHKVEMIFQELEELKHSRIDTHFMQDRSVQEEILKEVFDKRVEQIMDKFENKERISNIFDDFNFNLVRASSLEICIVLLKDKITANRFRKFLLNKRYLTTVEVNLILEYLCQTAFNDKDLVDKLQQNKYMEKIVDLYTNSYVMFHKPGYYELNAVQVRKVSAMCHVVEQARLRVMSEKVGNYSVALNHLLNEIHAVCLVEDKSITNHKEYDVKDVKLFLSSKGVSNDTIISIRNLFDRRNNNQISHPGFENILTWSVDEEEYRKYRSHVADCMKSIL